MPFETVEVDRECGADGRASVRSETDADDATVPGIGLAGDETGRDEPIDEPGRASRRQSERLPEFADGQRLTRRSGESDEDLEGLQRHTRHLDQLVIEARDETAAGLEQQAEHLDQRSIQTRW